MKIRKYPYLVAITGSFGVGKSAVGGILKKKGFLVIDTDNIVKDVLCKKNAITKKIINKFGNIVLSAHKGEYIDKKKLASVVFSDEKKKKLLESFLHPYVIKELKRLFDLNKIRDIIFALVPLLFEAKMERGFDEIWCVTCQEKIQLKRLQKRGFTLKDARQRINLQLPQAKKAKLSDYVIDNSFGFKKTYKQVMKRVQLLVQLVHNRHLSSCK